MFNSLQLDLTHSKIDTEYVGGGKITLSYEDFNLEVLMFLDGADGIELADNILELLEEEPREKLLDKIDKLENKIEELEDYTRKLVEVLDNCKRRDRYIILRGEK